MKITKSIIVLTLILILGLWIVQCGDTEDGEATTFYDDDDDDTADDTGCNTTITFVYDTCGFSFVDEDEETIASDDALIDCLTNATTSDVWVCRINCGQGVDDCDLLYNCLVLCPED